jgi:hypothetical protein
MAPPSWASVHQAKGTSCSIVHATLTTKRRDELLDSRCPALKPEKTSVVRIRELAVFDKDWVSI